jgi:thioredoxin-like negative regulator of GroEL
VQRCKAAKLKSKEINIDQHQEAANQLGIQSIPTLIAFKAGKEMVRLIGLQDIKALDRVLNDLLE